MSKLEDRRQKKYLAQKAKPDTSRNHVRGLLNDDVLFVKSDTSKDITPEKMKIAGKANGIKGASERIPVLSGEEFKTKGNLRATMRDAVKRGDKSTISKLQDIARKLGKGASKGLKSVPILGALASLATAEDASAAIPLLDTADSVGMSPEDENQFLAETQGRMDYQDSPARQDRLAALAKLLKSNR